MNGYFFLTGATGLLGNYLMRDLLRAGCRVAVLVRSNRRMTGQQRIENLLARWDAESDEPLPRPVVLEGDISQPDLGLDANDLRWVSEYCTAIIHNAASLTFQATSQQGEPYRSNVQGTQNVLDFARQANIREFHHVSTAYVAGLRSGRILESEGDVGQQMGNDYETSKLAAEKLVRSADFINPPTVYRPGIIIGDSQTGFTTTYHGFYAALQLAHTLAQTIDQSAAGKRDELGRICASDVHLNLNGNETKHLVPVDWVSGAMTYVLTHAEHHGKTYHLTPRQPITTRVIRDVLEDAIGLYGAQLAGADYVPRQDNEAEALFHEHIRVYNSYWRMDPEFDSTNIQQAAPHLLCPHVDQEMLLKLSRIVIADNFPTPAKKANPLEFDLDSALQVWKDGGDAINAQRGIALDVRGPGGGQCQLLLEMGQVVGVESGIHPETTHVIETDVRTFSQLLRGEMTMEEAFASGSICLSGAPADAKTYNLLEQLVAGTSPTMSEAVSIGDA